MQTINTTNLNEARKQIDSLASKKQQVIVLSQDQIFNQKILDNKKVNVLILNEDLKLKDYMKQRESQLNEPLCKLAEKNKIKIAIDIDKIIKKPDTEKAKSLARLRQNIILCKKNKTQLIALTKEINKNKKLISSLFLTLGASTQQAKKVIQESFFN